MTTLAMVVLTSLLIIFLYYIIQIARHLEYTSRKLKEEADRIMEDVLMVRESIEEQGSKAMNLMKFVFGSFIRSGNGSAGDGEERTTRKSRAGGKKKVKKED
ncbi:MAG: hypothetical protein WCQ00_00015 [bacterium]